MCLTTSVAKASNIRLVVYEDLGMMWRKAVLPWFEVGIRCMEVFILRLGGVNLVDSVLYCVLSLL